MKLLPIVALSLLALPVVSAACVAGVETGPQVPPTDRQDSGASGDDAATADATFARTKACGEMVCLDEDECCSMTCCQPRKWDAGTSAPGTCTAGMLGSIERYCVGAGSGSYFTGLLDFACARTDANAPDRAQKIGAFCEAHKVGKITHAGVPDSDDGFYCYCFAS